MKKEFITNYITGESSAQERAAVEAWIHENPAHKAEYLQLKKIWEMNTLELQPPAIDLDQAWLKFKELRETKAGLPTGEIKALKRPFAAYVWMAAAGLLLVFGASFFWLNSRFSANNLLRTAATETKRMELPDGSTVSLNTATEMSYHKTWLGKDRQVELLRGAVFFDVKKDPKHPFVIQAGQHRITVLGTSFHVLRKANETEVIVASGRVRVNYADKELFLTANQGISIPDTVKGLVKVDSIKDNFYRYYVHQEFVFENTPLQRVFEVLGKAYNKEFILDEKLRKLPYTASFEQQSLSEMLAVIVKTFNLKVEQQADKYFIK